MTHPYATKMYAESLSHCGQAFNVPEWNTSVLIREIEPGLEDAFGTYPLAILDRCSDIGGGLERLRDQKLISVVLVLDDFHRPPTEELKRHFTFIKPFKTHYIHTPGTEKISYGRHHRYELRQALKTVRVAPLDLHCHLEQWTALYTQFISHKKLTGLHVFPVAHHRALEKLTGVTAIGAWENDELVSCHIWVREGDCVHSHLAASSTRGYSSRAAYAINDASLHHFSDAAIINLGGCAGSLDNPADGLAKFKQGFSNDTAVSYVCGVVLDEDRYRRLILQRGIQDQGSFFPAYRG